MKQFTHEILCELYQDIYWNHYNLQSFGAIVIKGEFFFEKEDNCQKCCDYLQEIYGPILELAGGRKND